MCDRCPSIRWTYPHIVPGAFARVREELSHYWVYPFISRRRSDGKAHGGGDSDVFLVISTAFDSLGMPFVFVMSQRKSGWVTPSTLRTV